MLLLPMPGGLCYMVTDYTVIGAGDISRPLVLDADITGASRSSRLLRGHHERV